MTRANFIGMRRVRATVALLVALLLAPVLPAPRAAAACHTARACGMACCHAAPHAMACCCEAPQSDAVLAVAPSASPGPLALPFVARAASPAVASIPGRAPAGAAPPALIRATVGHGRRAPPAASV